MGLESAIEEGNLTRVRELLSGLNETNPIIYKSPSGRFYTALHIAAKYGKLDIIKQFAQNIENMHPYDSSGQTPMHYATFNNQTEVMKYYLESKNITDKNPKQNSTDGRSGRTPLHDATEKGKVIYNRLAQVTNPDSYL